MPGIKLTDRLNVQIDVELNKNSSLGKYLKDPAEVKCKELDLSQLTGVSLDRVPLKSLNTGLEFQQKVGLGVGDAELTIKGGLSGGFKLLSDQDKQLFDPDLFGDQIAINPGQIFLSMHTTAKIGAELANKKGDLSFGFSPSSDMTLSSYNLFNSDQAHGFPPALDAFKQAIGEFVIPGDLEDLDQMKLGNVSTVEGSGSLKVSGTFDVLSVTNPLAVVDLPEPIGEVKLKAGGSIKIGASFELTGGYQIRVHKIGARKVRLGYYRRKGTEFGVKATGSFGLSAGVGNFDAIEQLLKAISSDPKLDADELKKGGLSEGQIEAIKKVIEAGISRKLELAASFELNTSSGHEAAFLFEIDLAALSDAGRSAVHKALDGDLSGLGMEPPPGVTSVRTIFTETKKTKHTLKINLLGIYNFTTVSTLVLKGTVMFDPQTGELVITDKATASRIAASVLNFAADSKKLRKVMSESILISAAYRCSKLIVQAPQIKVSQSYVELHTTTDSTVMKNNLDVFEALGLLKQAEKQALMGLASNFGRSIFTAEASYDEAAAESLFFSNNKPRTRDEFEKAGRRAVTLLVQAGERDAIRRLPAQDDGLWGEMKTVANPMSFKSIPRLKNISDFDFSWIRSDFSVIVWWATSMSKMAQSLADIREYLSAHPATDPENNSFKKLRQELASRLKDVASKTHEQFHDPWGLVAMDQISGQKADAKSLITSEQLTLSKARG